MADEAGRRFERGVREAVSAETFDLYQRPPYRDAFEFVEPRVPVAREAAACFAPAAREGRRDPRSTKGADYRVTSAEPCG